MDVLFVNAQDELELRKEVNGQLILGTLLLQAGFDVNILRFCEIDSFKEDYEKFINNIVQRILAKKPSAVSFYSLWPDYHIMLRIAKELKSVQPEIYTVFGGPQASATAQETMESIPYADFICSGEGENTVVPFFTALLRNNNSGLESIPGLYYRENGKVLHHNLEHPLCNLDTLPYWDERLYIKHYQNNHEDYTSNKYYMPIDAGRGCPFNCTFCCTSRFWKRAYRMKSVDSIINEIKYLQTKFNIQSFRFSHDALTVNKKLIHALCDRIISEKLNIKWKCASRIDCIDEDLIIKMKESGLVSIELGVETGSPRMQQLINKKLDLSHVNNTVHFLLQNQINVALFFMYGFPNETEEDLEKTLSLQFSLLDEGVSYSSMALCRFNPATELTKKYHDQLTFEPDVKSLFRDVFGTKDELHLISKYKSIFPFYYHIHTPVRDKYASLFFLLMIYQSNPSTIKYARQLYNNDNIKFYEDFVKNNSKSLQMDVDELMVDLRSNTVAYIKNTIQDHSQPWIPQMLARLQFDQDVHTVSSSSEDLSIQSIYDFSFIDYMLKLPIPNYSKGATEILLKKNNGQFSYKIIRYC